MSAVGRLAHVCRFTLYSIGISRRDTSCKGASGSDHSRIAASRHRTFVICHDTCRIGFPGHCTRIVTVFDDAILGVVSGDPGNFVSTRYRHVGSDLLQRSRIGSCQCGCFISALEDTCQGKVLHRSLVVRDQALAVFQVKVFNGMSRTVQSSCKARICSLSADAGPNVVVEIQICCQNSFQISGILCSFFGKPCQFCRRSDLIYAVILLRRILGRFALPSVVVLFRIVGFHSPVLPCQHRISAVDPIGICCKAVAQVFAGESFQPVGSFGGRGAVLNRAAIQIANSLVFIGIEYVLHGSAAARSFQPSCHTALCCCFHDPCIVRGFNSSPPEYACDTSCRRRPCRAGCLHCSQIIYITDRSANIDLCTNTANQIASTDTPPIVGIR